MLNLTVQVDKVHGSDHEGHFLDDSSFERVVDEDCNVFDMEGNLLLAFRKGVVPQPSGAFEFFKKVATVDRNLNRGLAAGRELDWFVRGNWRLSTGQIKVLELGAKGKLTSVQQVEDILAQGQDPSTSVWHSWFPRSRWESFLQETLALPQKRWPQAFKSFMDKAVSKTKRKNFCYSNILGSFGRTNRYPYCRQSVSSLRFASEAKSLEPWFRTIGSLSQELLPEAYAAMESSLEQVDPGYRLADTAFTSITVNWNFRLASHFDARNLEGGFSALTVFERGEFKGHYLVFPETKLAFNLRQGDLLCGDNTTLLHGNTAKTGEGERVSLVFFARQDIADHCHCSEEENLRYEFVSWSKKHLGSKYGTGPRWNGVWPKMFESEEWLEFKTANTYLG